MISYLSSPVEAAGDFFAPVFLVRYNYPIWWTEAIPVNTWAHYILDSWLDACRSAVLRCMLGKLFEQNASQVYLEKLKLRISHLCHAHFAKNLRGRSPKCGDYFDSRVFLSIYRQSETVLAWRMESYLLAGFLKILLSRKHPSLFLLYGCFISFSVKAQITKELSVILAQLKANVIIYTQTVLP